MGEDEAGFDERDVGAVPDGQVAEGQGDMALPTPTGRYIITDSRMCSQGSTAR
jgi:hypothetical protein